MSKNYTDLYREYIQSENLWGINPLKFNQCVRLLCQEYYLKRDLDGEKLYDGYVEINTTSNIIDKFYKDKELNPKELDEDLCNFECNVIFTSYYYDSPLCGARRL